VASLPKLRLLPLLLPPQLLLPLRLRKLPSLLKPLLRPPLLLLTLPSRLMLPLLLLFRPANQPSLLKK
jgi:hypothetical protein